MDLWFLPLGGTGEIGMNLNLYGHNRSWLMVDCGVTFSNHDKSLPDVIMANPEFIVRRRSKLAGLVLTHAHEDHIGALVHLWSQLKCPVYATPFAADVLRRKLREHRLLAQVPLHEVVSGDTVKLGPFQVRWLSITHSIPEANALLIETSIGRIFHTGDWKIDEEPLLGAPIDADQFRALADLGVNAMVCDSTNAMVAGTSGSESSLLSGLLEAVNSAKQAVVVTTFASNLARLNSLAKVASATGRNFCLLGMSMRNMLKTAQDTGYWDDQMTPSSPRQIHDYPRSKRLIIAAGSQGDEGAALYRLAQGTHQHYALEAGDCVIFSSRIIPGNEEQVEDLVKMLKRKQIRVIIGSDQKIHVSGHPAVEELRQMYGWVKPKLVIPTHGTAAHMAANAKIAAEGGSQTLTGTNGDLFRIAPQPTISRQFAFTGRLGCNAGSKLRVLPKTAMAG